MRFSEGTRLGSYEILSVVGAGGMGEVFSARDEKLGRTVAIKVLPEAFALDEARAARFERAVPSDSEPTNVVVGLPWHCSGRASIRRLLGK